MSLVALRTAAAGGADAQQTSAEGMWNQITAALISAGWTTHYTITAQDIVYTSTGESGNEKLYLRIAWATTNLNYAMYQYFDSSGGAGYNAVMPAASFSTQFTFTAGNNHDYVIVANKDAFSCITRDVTSNARRLLVAGNLTRNHNEIATFFTSNATVTAGANKTFNFSSGNPVTAGYKVGDVIMVVSQQTTGPAAGVIPVYSAQITALTTSSITVDYAQEDTDAGAFVGMNPMPFFYFTNTANADPFSTANYVYVGNVNMKYTTGPTNIYQIGTANQGFVCAALYKGLGNNVAELDPNKRGERIAITGGIAASSATGQVAGSVPFIYLNPRTSDAVWAIGRSTKTATIYDYATFPLTMPSTGARFMIGPIATSGSASFNVDVYDQASDNWVENILEVVVPHVLTNQTAKTNGDTWVAETQTTDTDNLMVNVRSPTQHEMLQVDQNGPERVPSGETVPFDTIQTTIVTGGGGSNFNTGFN